MKRLIIACFLLSFTIKSYSQSDSIVNPYKNWFFGAEMGLNHIISFNWNEQKNSFQGGLIAEYFLTSNWSAMARLKYFKIGQSSGRSDASYRKFDGESIALILNIKWEYKIAKNFRGFLKTGFALNQETVSNYQYYEGERTNCPTFFVDYNILGIGFSQYINTNTAIYVEAELKGLGKDRDDGPTFITPNSTDNYFLNIGIKHNFKRK
ncbi:hypothetical protein UMM65_00380 [Aureibaculum sp. 2210JD6-5]|uniref:hypothetical protein n=1 Tax=Aureibaculum sp. 2210JD6-5 TaxID=3103957 RepID=UPI002AAEAB27|nr:hypothetical protein [Aureibaculum sp. 2210JD6-5]MDY7393685.1 hypothetical protein [Aureibaculum sp. 2210JD6-5]